MAANDYKIGTFYNEVYLIKIDDVNKNLISLDRRKLTLEEVKVIVRFFAYNHPLLFKEICNHYLRGY